MTVFPSHFNNIFLKSLWLLQTLTRNCMILQLLMRFDETNNIAWNFSGITLGFHGASKYFIDFIWFRFRYFQKMTAKFRFLLNRFEISKFHTFRGRKLKKVNITVTYVKVVIQTIVYIVWSVLLHSKESRKLYIFTGLWVVWSASVLLLLPSSIGSLQTKVIFLMGIVANFGSHLQQFIF